VSTKNDPGEFDCYAKALPDEPMFVLLGRDPSAPDLVSDWAYIRELDIQSGRRPRSDSAMVEEARRCAADMRLWRSRNDGAWRVSGDRLTAAERDIVEAFREWAWLRREAADWFAFPSHVSARVAFKAGVEWAQKQARARGETAQTERTKP